MRAIQQAIGKRIFCRRVAVTQRTRYLANAGINQCHGSKLTARQHKISQRNLNIYTTLDDALINAFVPPAQQYRAAGLGQIRRKFLRKWLALRRQIHN